MATFKQAQKHENSGMWCRMHPYVVPHAFVPVRIHRSGEKAACTWLHNTHTFYQPGLSAAAGAYGLAYGHHGMKRSATYPWHSSLVISKTACADACCPGVLHPCKPHHLSRTVCTGRMTMRQSEGTGFACI